MYLPGIAEQIYLGRWMANIQNVIKLLGHSFSGVLFNIITPPFCIAMKMIDVYVRVACMSTLQPRARN